MKTKLRPQDEDTICALVTPYGKGGLSVLRVSGSDTVKVVTQICPFLPKKPRSHQAYFGSLKYKEKVIDEVVALFFEENRSFTSEPTIEISCHGSPIICEEILQTLQDLGCRMAERGEFTYRAFLSGRIDLIQAESTLHLIEASSQKAKKQALSHLQGKLSQELEKIKKQTQNLLAHIEASFDFSEEDITTISSKELLNQITDIQKNVNEILKNYKQGLRVREGLRVGIFGTPNSGKSTLLNQLLEKERAIVSSEKGTTRDQVEGDLFLNGHKIKITDTAGIRETKNLIEKEGIKRTLQSLDSLDVCIYLIDVTSFKEDLLYEKLFSKEGSKTKKDLVESFYESLLQRLKQNEEDVFFVLNKIDILPKEDFLKTVKKETSKEFKNFLEKAFFVSAHTSEGVSEVKGRFLKFFQEGEEACHIPRHFLHFKEIQKNLKTSQELLHLKEAPFELLSEELKQVLKHLQNILGQDVSTDVLDEIFGQFCIGK